MKMKLRLRRCDDDLGSELLIKRVPDHYTYRL